MITLICTETLALSRQTSIMINVHSYDKTLSEIKIMVLMASSVIYTQR